MQDAKNYQDYPNLKYTNGFNNELESEALDNALPRNQNSPQHAQYGLYAEQINGSAFTAPRHINHKSWLYKIYPSVVHSKYELSKTQQFRINKNLDIAKFPALQLRWSPLEYPENPKSFYESLSPLLYNECGTIILYSANKNVDNTAFVDNDGELLILPQEGALLLTTEMGKLCVAPHEIAVIPRGIKFSVELINKKSKGYILENVGPKLNLPELGLIGANGSVNPKDFLYPAAYFEDNNIQYKILTKFQNAIFESHTEYSPFNTVAWRGNYAPYKYNLDLFNAINTVNRDHIDPSIFTVLTSNSPYLGTANIDFVIFPPRWQVAEHTFRPPYFHRNIMSEYMGLLTGQYDAKDTGFIPGGGSLHNCMAAHGPDSDTVKKTLDTKLKPEKLENTLAFMFESSKPWIPTEFALDNNLLQQDYNKCWQDIEKHFPNEQKN